MLLRENINIVMQGDSVTDAGRGLDSRDLGNGYPRFVADILQAKYPDYCLKIFNRGVSGNRSSDLLLRWDRDCTELQPDIVTILIGVNDTWRRFDRKLYMSPDDYSDNVEKLIKMTLNTGADIILLEPFILPVGQPLAAWHEWNTDIGDKIVRLRELAVKYETAYIPLMSIFAGLYLNKAPEFYTGDGVHPNMNGHRVIASEIINKLEK